MFKLREEKIIGYWGYMTESGVIYIEKYSEHSEKIIELKKNHKKVLFVIEKPVFMETKAQAIKTIERRLNEMKKSLHPF